MLCKRVGMSRQNYYAVRRLRQRRQVDEELILALVRQERKIQARLGGRKLLHIIQDDLQEAGVSVGRDRFFELLAEHDLLVVPKLGAPHTTNSRHNLPVFTNLVEGLIPTAPHQLWVGDMTYIRTDEGFVFAAVIMDRYSRKIVGANIGDTLETIGCVHALDQAMAQLPSEAHPIHHTDRGCQYASHLYVERLQSRELPISMTVENHCYENAYAERVIGILKQEYEMDATFCTKHQAYVAFLQALELYNNRRPHLSLNYQTPDQVHRRAA